MKRELTYQPVRYFVSVFVATFLLWGVGAYMSFDDDLRPYYMLPMLIGLMAPFLVALLLIVRGGREAQRRDFVHRIIDVKRINAPSFVRLLLIMPASVLGAIAISVLWGGDIAQFQPKGTFSFSSGFVPVVLLLFLAAAFEELGWRGYGFESLHERHGLLGASLLFGLLWSAWHLPLIVVQGSYQYEIFQLSPWFALNFHVSTVVLGLIVTWVCVTSRGSILAAVVFHFVVNICQEALSMTQETKVIQTGLLGLAALIIVWVQRRHFLPRRPLWRSVQAPCAAGGGECRWCCRLWVSRPSTRPTLWVCCWPSWSSPVMPSSAGRPSPPSRHRRESSLCWRG